jgi:hypothetical protein
MYKVVGADRREYGPVSRETLLEWIAQGRANAQTIAKFEDGAWRPLASFDEFKAALGLAGSAKGAGIASAGPGTTTSVGGMPVGGTSSVGGAPPVGGVGGQQAAGGTAPVGATAGAGTAPVGGTTPLIQTTYVSPEPPPFSGVASQRETNVASVVGIIVPVVCCCCPFIGPLIGLVFSFVGLSQIRANPAKYSTSDALPKIGIGIAIAILVLHVVLKILDTTIARYLPKMPVNF